MLRARPAAIAVAVAAFAVACAEDGAILPGADAASAADASTTVTDAATPDVVWSEAAGRGVTFDKLTLDTAFRAEGVAVFDVDRDGHLDVVTDQTWYAGPAFAPHAIRAAESFDPATTYSRCQAVYGEDVDRDGWTDAIVVPRPFDPASPPPEPVLWYQNPAGAAGLWATHVLASSTAVETAVVHDLFADGRFEVVMGQEPALVLTWFAPGADPTQPWVAHPISAAGFAGAGHYVHGLGTGDVDGDGRLDVLTGYGWFQQTADHDTWTWHVWSFGPNPDACSEMHVLDVDGDGKGDVLCARPHDYGIHWWQQAAPDDAGEPTFVDHLVDASVSQTHAFTLGDLDGDGLPELVTGKRWWAHGPAGDPGATDPAVLVYYSLLRGPGGAVSFERHDIDDDSGIGTQFPVGDVDGDGKLDVVASNKKGLFVFRQR